MKELTKNKKDFSIKREFIKFLSLEHLIKLENYIYNNGKKPKYIKIIKSKPQKMQYYIFKGKLEPKFLRKKSLAAGKIVENISMKKFAKKLRNKISLTEINLHENKFNIDYFKKLKKFSLKNLNFVYNLSKSNTKFQKAGTQENIEDIENKLLKVKKETKYNLVSIDCEMVEVENENFKGLPVKYYDVNESCDNIEAKKLKISSNLSICSNFKDKNQRHIARITIIDEEYNKILDMTVIPPFKIKNFHTKHSGLTKEKFGESLTISELKTKLEDIIGVNTFILGHSLKNDLFCMSLFHEKIIDTSYLYLQTDGYKLSLKSLVQTYLDKKIQKNTHCSFIDAKSTLDLFRLKYFQLYCNKKDKSMENLKTTEKSRKKKIKKAKGLKKNKEIKKIEEIKRKRCKISIIFYKKNNFLIL